ncbi:uncharacterized protein DUF664 [Mumia flava]|uniref:Uncharacterized protein DUF664 n=1 Tax=Mumia flava TaxID=1348852 RepID=A0A0B2BTR1_9ACTN|nr:uncharacterized protein DUF664 [Mumia flava]
MSVSDDDRGVWMPPEDDPRETGEQPVGEKDTIRSYLRHYRTTLEMKCEGLDAEQLARRSVPPSTLSLLGLVRHMAEVERHWFRRVLQGQSAPPMFWTDDDPDGDFDNAVADDAVVADAWERLREEIAVADAYLDGDIDLGAEVTHHGRPVPVRDILVHMVEEYARHAGHADLLRECIDGRTGQ